MSEADGNPREMTVVGYSDPLTVAPGETIDFKVSCEPESYRLDVVRLVHGDVNPDGPGFREVKVEASINTEYEGRAYGFEHGSCVLVPDGRALDALESFTVEAWIYPTQLDALEPQAILSRWCIADARGFGLFVDEGGALSLWLGAGPGRLQRISASRPLVARTWQRVSARYSEEDRSAGISQSRRTPWPLDDAEVVAEEAVQVDPEHEGLPLVIGACAATLDAASTRTAHHFNGKIDRPHIFGAAVEVSPSSQPAGSGRGSAPAPVVAAWDFGSDPASMEIPDRSGSGLHGKAVNMPMRAVTGANWDGSEIDFRRAPEQYGAIYFHDDDLEDAGWPTAVSWTVPDDLRSGIYAARLQAEGGEDYVPFFVRPARGTASARIAFLVPTLTYVVYGSEHISGRHPASLVTPEMIEPYLQPEDRYAAVNRILSCYDLHSDGSGVCYASRLRPLMNMRPKYRLPLIRAPFNFSADLHLADWLEAKGFKFDVITDDDLDAEGAALLEPYAAVVTGTHPEYYTGAMLDALEAYTHAGGRLMYLGGNGFYWVTSVDTKRPHVVEVRRGHAGTGTWRSEAGEVHHSTTGEPAGLWRHRGRHPQKYFGVGMAAQGSDVSLPYRREEGSRDPRVAFIFEGVDDDAVIGDRGLVMGGAAGFEIDRLDYELGTPPHALLVACARGFSDRYQHVVEEVAQSNSKQGGSVSPFVRADVVYFETLNGGAVFSVGSITWCGCLSADDYDSPVSRITGNVLREFSAGSSPAEAEGAGAASVAAATEGRSP